MDKHCYTKESENACTTYQSNMTNAQGATCVTFNKYLKNCKGNFKLAALIEGIIYAAEIMYCAILVDSYSWFFGVGVIVGEICIVQATDAFGNALAISVVWRYFCEDNTCDELKDHQEGAKETLEADLKK